MSRKSVRRLTVAVALCAGLSAVPSAQAVGDADEARECKALSANSTLPIRTDDFEQVDCFLDDIGVFAGELAGASSVEIRSCPSEAAEDPPFQPAEDEAAEIRKAIATARPVHEQLYATIDRYLGSKRTYYLAKYLNTPGARGKVDDQINVVGTKVRAFRKDERDFLSELEILASQLAGHDCGAAAQTLLQINSTVADLRTIEGPEVNRAADKLLALIKLPARKKPKPKPKAKKAADRPAPSKTAKPKPKPKR